MIFSLAVLKENLGINSWRFLQAGYCSCHLTTHTHTPYHQYQSTVGTSKYRHQPRENYSLALSYIDPPDGC